MRKISNFITNVFVYVVATTMLIYAAPFLVMLAMTVKENNK